MSCAVGAEFVVIAVASFAMSVIRVVLGFVRDVHFSRPTAARLRRAAAVVGVVGLTAGAGVLAAGGSALAGVGSQPGTLTLLPASGPSSTIPTYQTTIGCPANFQSSAQLSEFNTDGSYGSIIANGVATPTAAFSGSVNYSVANALSLGTNVGPGQTSEWAIGCYSGPAESGNVEYVMSTFVTLSASGSTYTATAAPPGPVGSTTTLVATPNPVAINTTITLKATVADADSSVPAGTVNFYVGASTTPINASPVNVVAGVAQTTTSFAAAGSESLSAVYTPNNTTGFTGSSGTYSESVGTTNATGNNPVSVTFTVQSTGTLTVSVGTGSSPLTVTGLTATGTLPTVTITESRTSYPGWSVSGQEGTFTGSGTAAGATMSGNQLGWVPAFVGAPVDGATPGPTVTPAAPGLGTTPGQLAWSAAGCGFGVNTVNATLNLIIPASQLAGPYAGTLNITYITTQPSGSAGCVPVTVGF
jgi:hypothetical protein